MLALDAAGLGVRQGGADPVADLALGRALGAADQPQPGVSRVTGVARTMGVVQTS